MTPVLTYPIEANVTVRGFTLVFLQFGLLGLLIISPAGHAPTFAPIASVILYGVAVIGAVPAFVNLRPALTALPEPKEGAPLVTHGIYRWIRHPMYTALLSLSAGLAVARWTVLALVIASLMAIVLSIKSRYEDRLLRNRWPQAREYQSRTGRFLPRLRRP